MSIFDQAYDKMSWKDVCCRLPGNLAVEALKRRATNLETIKMFVKNINSSAMKVNTLKSHINNILSNYTVNEILDTFDDPKDYPILFNWISNKNIERIKNQGYDKLDIKLAFNLTNSDDITGMSKILDKILAEPKVKQSHINAILRKADSICMPSILDKIIKDSRPEVRCCLLAIPGLTNNKMVSNHQKVIGLKAFSKCADSMPLAMINKLPISVFSALKVKERMIAMEKYLNYFPENHEISIFVPKVSDEEFNAVMFAGCIGEYEKFEKISDKYNKITKPIKKDKKET